MIHNLDESIVAQMGKQIAAIYLYVGNLPDTRAASGAYQCYSQWSILKCFSFYFVVLCSDAK